MHANNIPGVRSGAYECSCTFSPLYLVKTEFEEAIQINPFNPDVHVGLANASAMLGDSVASAQERDIAHRLRR